MKHDIFSLKNKVCIVTGGYQGIGEIVAGYIADAGADIAIFDMNNAREILLRSEERRVGKECRSRWSPYH